MGGLVVVGLLGLLAVAGATRSRSGGSAGARARRPGSGWSRSTPVARLDAHQAALRVGWTQTQTGIDAARAVISQWLGVPRRTAIDAGRFSHELQTLHQDALADFAIDTWNRSHASAATPGDPLSVGPQQAAQAVGDQSSEENAHRYIAQWLARPGRTAIEAGQLTRALQTLGLNAAAEYALDTWNERPQA